MAITNVCMWSMVLAVLLLQVHHSEAGKKVKRHPYSVQESNQELSTGGGSSSGSSGVGSSGYGGQNSGLGGSGLGASLSSGLGGHGVVLSSGLGSGLSGGLSHGQALIGGLGVSSGLSHGLSSGLGGGLGGGLLGHSAGFSSSGGGVGGGLVGHGLSFGSGSANGFGGHSFGGGLTSGLGGHGLFLGSGLSKGFSGQGLSLASGLGGHGLSLSGGLTNGLGGGLSHLGGSGSGSGGDSTPLYLVPHHDGESDGDDSSFGDEKFSAYHQLLSQAGIGEKTMSHLNDEANSKIKLILLQAQINQKMAAEKVAKMRSQFGLGTFGYKGYQFPLKTEPFELGTHHAIDLGTSLDTKSLKDSDGKIKLPVQTVYITKTVGVKIPHPVPIKHEVPVPAPYPVPVHVPHHSSEGYTNSFSSDSGSNEEGGDSSEGTHYESDSNSLGHTLGNSLNYETFTAADAKPYGSASTINTRIVPTH